MKKLIYFIAGLIVGISLVSAPVMAYTVQSGDVLWKIAQNANLSVSELIEMNPQIENPDLIYPGQEINTSQAYNLELPFFKKLASQNEGLLGGNDINFVQVQNLYLSGSGISSTQNTIGLTSFKYPVNELNVVMEDFGDIGYAVIEPDTNREENISFTGITQNANGSATLTGVSRGLGLSYPYTASSTLASAHAGGTILRISNTAPFYNEFNIKGKDETITGLWTFNQLPLFYSTDTATSSEQFITKRYADNLVNQGAATSSESVAGIAELATQLEMASSTQFSIEEPHVINSEYASSTPTVRGLGYLPVTENDGYLSQLWIDLSESFAFTGNNTFSGENTFSATTTMATTTITDINVIGDVDITGDLNKGTKLIYATTTGVSALNTTTETSLGSFTLPANYLSTGNIVKIEIPVNSVAVRNTKTFSVKLKYGATTLTTAASLASSDATGKGFITAYLMASGATDSQKGTVFLNAITDGASGSGLGGVIAYNSGTATEDSTSALTVEVTGTSNEEFASSGILTGGMIVTLLRY